MWKYNKGEWSEIYAFAYLLNQGVLYAADENLNKIEDVYFPIIKIIREEMQGREIDYYCGDKIQIYRGDTLLREVSKTELNNMVETLLDKIPQGDRAFEIEGTEQFFNSIYCSKVKANASHKEDLKAQIHDVHTGISPVVGFSIKSFLGSQPTLINPGSNTNFVYIIRNCTDEIMENVNNVNTKNKILDRIQMLKDKGCTFEIEKHCISPQFEENLQFVDTAMPEMLQLLLQYFYESDIKDTCKVIEIIKQINPLKYSNTEMYTYKIKKLLAAWALGMTPEKKWLGNEDANGGYIAVKSNGDVVCYHIYNRMDFENYLYNSTYFDRPSTSKFNYAKVYKENGVYKIKFCLQVRFRKK